MNRLLVLATLATLALLAITGCQAGGTRASLAARSAASGPKAIPILHQESLVYECPKCGMDYDGPGKCAMDQSVLVRTAVAYKCPSDGQPVEHSGKCPRCAASAIVEKTAIADAGPAPSGGK